MPASPHKPGQTPPAPSFGLPFDSVYFSSRTWRQRLDTWKSSQSAQDSAFAAANEVSIRRRLEAPDTCARVVVNIRATDLLKFLDAGKYRNAYELEQIDVDRRVGGDRPVSDHRKLVDEKIGTSEQTYYAAVSLGGAGVRYFGEYCMVLKREGVPPSTPLIDRDSYDVLFPPLDAIGGTLIRDVLCGEWEDVEEMILMRVLPRIQHDHQVVTSGTVIELALADQEYIEVHLDDSFTPADVDEVVEPPEASATESRILERERRGLSNSMHEIVWADRRAIISRRLQQEKVRQRVVTQHGRGYQWT